MSIKIESDLRSFEKNKFEFRFVFTVKLPATAEKKFTVASIFTRIFRSFSMRQRKQESYVSQKIVDIV